MRSTAQAFDEWMRRYKENPEKFGNDMTAAKAHSNKPDDADASEYGNTCAAFLEKLMGEE
jgi:hypothetical protein